MIVNAAPHIIIIITVAAAVRQVSAGVQLVYPISKQKSPVARVGQPFTFNPIPGTFETTGNATMIWTASQLPNWATFDPNSKTFSGTPNSSDVGKTAVVVTATDTGTNSSASSTWNLIVTKRPAPQLNLPIASQLKNGAVLSSVSLAANVSSVSIPPAYSWSIGLLPNTLVSSTGAQIFYSASQQGSISLPDWISFDPNTITFDGLTPASPCSVVIDLYGSDQFGYGDVKQSLTITVSRHVMDLSQPLPILNASVNQNVSYVIPTSAISIDGFPANNSDVFDIEVDLTQAPYLRFDSFSRTLSGMVPSSIPLGLSLPIRFLQASLESELATNITIEQSSATPNSTLLPPVHLTPGANFSVDLSPYILTTTTNLALAAINPSDASTWVMFSSNPPTIFGSAPKSPPYTNVSVTIEAVEEDKQVGSVSLVLMLVDGSLSKAQPTSSASGSKSRHLTQKEIGIIASVFGTVGGLILLIMLLVCCRKHCEGSYHGEGDHVVYLEPVDEKNLKEANSPMSLGSTLVGSATPTCKGLSPMMAVTPTESSFLAATREAVEKYGIDNTKPRQYGLFSIFPPESLKSPKIDVSHTNNDNASVHGLGISAPTESHIQLKNEASKHRIIVDEPADEPDLGMANLDTPFQSSDDDRSSWNSVTSSSLFYSDTMGEESDSPLPYQRNERRIRGGQGQSATSPSSVPRQRRDFISPKLPNTHSSSLSSASSDSRSVGVGGIRLIGGPNSRLSARSDDAVTVESFGAIAVATCHLVSPSLSDDGWDSNTPTPRPQLIPFVGRRSPQMEPCDNDVRSSSAIKSLVDAE